VTTATAIRTFVTDVAAVRRLTPRMVEITLHGGDLDEYVPREPDQFVYLLLPPPNRAMLTIDGSFTWEAYDQMPVSDRPVGAYYTVRRWHARTRSLDIVVVLHEDVGPASGWAASARAGDRVALWGPRTTYAPPDSTTSMLLVADETGTPAVAAILESVPRSMPVLALVETASPEERLTLPMRPSVDVVWLYRAGRLPGTTSMLVDAVRTLSFHGAAGLYAWGGAESRCITAVRDHLRNEVGMAAECVSMTGYWRRVRS